MPHVSGRMPALVAAVTAVLATASPLCAQPACRLDGPIPLAGDAHPECSPLSPPGRANLEITQTLPRQVECNADIPVEVVVANTGDAAAENVIVKDVLSADYQLLDAFPTPERLRGTLTWRLGRLERGDQRRLRLRLQLRDTTRVEFIHLVTATFETPVQSRGAAPVLHPGLALDVTGPDAVNVSEPFTLTVTIRNTGNGPARDMALQAALPAGLIHPAGADLENAIGTLDAGRTHTVALALIPTRTGDIGGRIRVVAKGVAAVEQAYRLHVRDVRLHLIAKEQAYGSPDGSYTFLWTVVNQGTEAALRARLEVQLPEGMAFVRAAGHGGYDPQTHSVTWVLSDLRAGEKRDVELCGIPRKPGEQECRVSLWAGRHLQQRLQESWSVKLAKTLPAPPPD